MSDYVEDYHILQSAREEKWNAPCRRHLRDSGVPVENSKAEAGIGGGDVVDRDPFFVFEREKRAQRAEGSGHALAGTKNFAQVARFYYRQDPTVRHSVLFPR